jgi:hypothetical protein
VNSRSLLAFTFPEVTTHATDIAGRLGSETVYFSIEPFPWLLVVVAWSFGCCRRCWAFGLLQISNDLILQFEQ